MNESSEGSVSGISAKNPAGDNRYLNYLATNVPALIKSPSLSKRVAKATRAVDFPEWYVKASAIDRQYLKELGNER